VVLKKKHGWKIKLRTPNYAFILYVLQRTCEKWHKALSNSAVRTILLRCYVTISYRNFPVFREIISRKLGERMNEYA
jgi:hypothetical protein